MRPFTLAAVAFLHLVQAGDQFKSMSAICLENGFKTESYTVTTEDDYILSLYRIPGMTAETVSDEPKPVVLMMHG